MGISSTISYLLRLRVLALTIAALIVPLSVYYLVYVRTQTTYFTERSFRALSLISNQVGSRVESACLVLQNVGDKFVDPNSDADERLQHGDLSEVNVGKIRKILRSLKEDSPELTATLVDNQSKEPISSEKAHRSFVTMTVKQEEGSHWLYLDYSYESNDGKNKVLVQAKADLKTLVNPVLRRPNPEVREENSNQTFGNILIARSENGNPVIFEEDETQLRITSLSNFTSAEDEQKKLAFNSDPQISNVVDIQSAGASYKLFFHPMELGVGSRDHPESTTKWIIAGLIPITQVRRATWSISFTWLIIIAYVTGMLIVSWPFLKLVLIGPKDRLRTADVYFVTFSTVIGLALITSFSLYIYSYLNLEKTLNGQLEIIAKDIKTNFNDELKDCLTQLDLLGNNDALLAKLKGPPSPAGTNQNVPLDIYSCPDTDRKQILPLIEASQRTTYPYFQTAVWIDDTGQQRAKWTIKDYRTKYISVVTRPYFTELREGHYRTLHELPAHKFRLEPIISKTTGRNEVEISQRIDADPKWISAFDARLISLMQPVLPTGFGFTIIGNDGTVLFHSDEARHLGENFFRECDNDSYLRSAVFGRSSLTMDARYFGAGYSLYSTPVEGFPTWTLIVFRDKHVLRTAFVEMLTLFGFLFLMYALCLLGIFSVFYLVNLNSNERRSWLWPKAGRVYDYWLSFGILTLLILISGATISQVDGTWLTVPKYVILASVLAFAGIVAFFAVLKFSRIRREPRQTNSQFQRVEQRNRVYVLNLSSLLVLISIMPSVAFFKYSYSSELNLIVKQGQLSLADAMAERDRRIQNEYGNRWNVEPQNRDCATIMGPAKENSEKDHTDRSVPFIEKRKKKDWDLYDRAFFGTVREVHVNPRRFEVEDKLLVFFNQFMPLYSSTSVARRGLLNIGTKGESISGPFADDLYYWEPVDSQSGRLLLHTDSINNPAKAMSTMVPKFTHPGVGIYLLWAVFAGFLVVFFFCVRFIVRRVFLLDVYKPSSFDMYLARNIEHDRNYFVVLERPFTEVKTFDSDLYYQVDVESLAKSPEWATNFDYKHFKDPQKAILIHHFEYAGNDPSVNRQKSYFLSQLLSKQNKVIVLSTAEPSTFSLIDPGSTSSLAAEQADRWVGIISKFFRIYAEDSGDPKAFEEKVDEELKNLEPTEKTKLVEQLRATLIAECKAKPPLQEIGLLILRQKDFIGLSPKHLVRRIGSQAEPYYRNLWEFCSADDKLTLYHLAQDRLLSPKDPHIEPLLRKGLIVRDSDVHVMNDSFREFVKSKEQLESVPGSEAEARKDSLWHTLKGPITIVLVAVVLFLFVTQPDSYTYGLAVITALTTAIPGFFKFLSLFQNDPVGGLSQTLESATLNHDRKA